MIPYAEDGRTLIPIAPDDRDWVLYVIFGLVGFETNPEEAEDRAEFIERWDHHVDWLAARFASPDAMLSSEGVDFCEIWGRTIPSPVLAAKWRHFKTAHAADTLADIDTLLATLLFVA
jgi:hypothetical protein